jgi:carboxymethylenebutenolidase
MDAYVAHPTGHGRHPGLVVIPEAFGVNHYIQNTCRHFADEGFVALAPDIYHRFGKQIQLGYTDMKPVMQYLSEMTNDGYLMDIQAALRGLRSQPHVHSEQVGVVGFCVGGLGTFIAACHTDAQTFVAFYGGGIVTGRQGFKLHPVLDEAPYISRPILMFFGAQDQSISAEDRAAIERQLTSLNVVHQIKVYDQAGHGFMCDERDSFRPDAASDAWKRTIAWFREYLQ